MAGGGRFEIVNSGGGRVAGTRFNVASHGCRVTGGRASRDTVTGDKFGSSPVMDSVSLEIDRVTLEMNRGGFEMDRGRLAMDRGGWLRVNRGRLEEGNHKGTQEGRGQSQASGWKEGCSRVRG